MHRSWLTRFVRTLSLTALLFGIGAPVYAGPVLFTSQAAFLAAIKNPGTDTFDDFSNTGATPSPILRTAGVYGYRAAVSTTSFYGAGTGVDHWLSTNTATDSITFDSFAAGVAGIGGFFFGTDIDGLFVSASSITVAATDASGATSSTLVNPSTTTFLGFVSTTAIASLTVIANQPTSGVVWPTVNNLILAQAGPRVVPEPGFVALLGLGAVAVLLARRRRRA